MNGTRKQTVYELCPTHRAYFAGESRYRIAEFFAEGGPSSACTSGDACKIRPGTDLFDASLCVKGGRYSVREGGWCYWQSNAPAVLTA